jgi:hypothetical protein
LGYRQAASDASELIAFVVIGYVVFPQVLDVDRL